MIDQAQINLLQAAIRLRAVVSPLRHASDGRVCSVNLPTLPQWDAFFTALDAAITDADSDIVASRAEAAIAAGYGMEVADEFRAS